MSVFDDVKRLVSVEEAAKEYGLRVTKSNYALCPFHTERTPSLKLYRDRFVCFGCGAGGSVIDLVGKLYGMTPIEAVKKLNMDFCLKLPLDQPMTQEDCVEAENRRRVAEARVLFDRWKEQMQKDLTDCIRVANEVNLDRPSDSDAMALRFREAFEYWSDTLSHGSMAEMMEVFRDRTEVSNLCKTVLNGSPTKSMTA